MVVQESSEFGYATPLGYQYWSNPVDGLVYAGQGQPDHGFNSSDNYFFKVFDPKQRADNMSRIKEASLNGELSNQFYDTMKTPYLDEEFYDAHVEWESLYNQNGRQKSAALISPTNAVTNILNVFAKTYGMKDRKYAGVELAQKIGIPNLVIDIDTLAKISGMAELAEMQMPKAKEIRYTRTHYDAKKFGLVFEVSEEAILKNLHNPFQDTITVAGTKVDQRKAYDVIDTLESGLTTTAALAAWDTYEANTDRSTQNPVKDIERIVLHTIEGTGEGGTFNRAGMNQITLTDYDTNSFNRGIIEPVGDQGAERHPGVRPLKGFGGTVQVVQDQFIPQGVAYLLDVGDETCCALFEGPQRVASKVDEMLNSNIYGIFDYHLAAIINASKGRRVSGVATPVAPV